MLHVPGLLGELVALGFVLFSALEDFEGLLAEGVFAGSVAHLREFGLVGGEFGVEGGEFDVDAGDAVVDLEGSLGLVWCMMNTLGKACLPWRLHRLEWAWEPHSWCQRGDSCWLSVHPRRGERRTRVVMGGSDPFCCLADGHSDQGHREMRLEWLAKLC